MLPALRCSQTRLALVYKHVLAIPRSISMDNKHNHTPRFWPFPCFSLLIVLLLIIRFAIWYSAPTRNWGFNSCYNARY